MRKLTSVPVPLLPSIWSRKKRDPGKEVVRMLEGKSSIHCASFVNP